MVPVSMLLGAPLDLGKLAGPFTVTRRRTRLNSSARLWLFPAMTAAAGPPSVAAFPAMSGRPIEAALHTPVKGFFERLGYQVKAEVRGCDLVARRDDEPLIIVELKRRFNLALLLQGIDRLALSERVYLAVPAGANGRRGCGAERGEVRKLCCRVGLGLLLVHERSGRVEILEEPVPYRPRRSEARRLRLVEEFDRRIGDTNIGGVSRQPIVTAYRQQALRCARALAECGPTRIAALRAANIPAAAQILQRNVYGWFARRERGVYGLTERGHEALDRFAAALRELPATA
jgi:hypothetical protein